MNVMDIYTHLRKHYGHQDWWPINHGFHPREFEICVGAILTQNTNWKNVEKALALLSKNALNSPEKISTCDLQKLEEVL